MILARGTGSQETALADARENGRYRVERIAGPDTQSLRLSEMGFVPGAEVSVVSRGRNGMVVVKVGGSRLALARGMADYVFVK